MAETATALVSDADAGMVSAYAAWCAVLRSRSQCLSAIVNTNTPMAPTTRPAMDAPWKREAVVSIKKGGGVDALSHGMLTLLERTTRPAKC